MTSRVLLTGAAGRLGTMLRERLPGYGWTLQLVDRVPMPTGDDARSGVGQGTEPVVGDITDPAVLDAALTEPTDAIVHFAGIPVEAPWPAIRQANLEGTFQVFEAARRHGVRRVVFASSNHAAGFTRHTSDLAADTPVRPDTLYGVSKTFGEALGRYYVDRYGLQVACLRIGTCAAEPPDHRALATWLSPDDCGRLVDAALRYPDLDYAVVWGISANAGRWWALDAGYAIGYHPQDDAVAYADRHDADYDPLPSDDLVGGGFTTQEYGIDEVATRE
jgi:uronate dehydrogenase